MEASYCYCMFQKHHVTSTKFFSKITIPAILSQDQEIWMGGTENNTLRNDISSTIKQCLYGQIFRTRLNEQYFQENNEYRNNGRGFTVDLPKNVPLTWNSVLGLSSNCSVRSPRLYSSLVLKFGWKIRCTRTICSFSAIRSVPEYKVSSTCGQ